MICCICPAPSTIKSAMPSTGPNPPPASSCSSFSPLTTSPNCSSASIGIASSTSSTLANPKAEARVNQNNWCTQRKIPTPSSDECKPYQLLRGNNLISLPKKPFTKHFTHKSFKSASPTALDEASQLCSNVPLFLQSPFNNTRRTFRKPCT